MKVAIAGLYLEANTFAVETMGLSTITGHMGTGFQKFEGQDLLNGWGDTKTPIGGYVTALKESPGVEMVPSVAYIFGVGPTIERGAYERMKGEILEELRAAMPLDGVALAMHGAAIAEGVDDVEADLSEAVRQLVGPKAKIVAGLDHHATVSDRFLRQMDFVTAVHHYPHVDHYDVAYRAAKLIPDMVRGAVKPYGHFEYLPFLMQVLSTMDGNCFAPIRRKVEEFSGREGIYEFSLFYGFALTDIECNKATVNCWAVSPELAASTAREFAAWLWERRGDFVVETVSAAEAVRRALAALKEQGRLGPDETVRSLSREESSTRLARADKDFEGAAGFMPDLHAPGPVVIAEKSDNPGGGAPGDATHVLWELIRHNVQKAAVCAIRDPETVEAAVKAGVGSVIDVALGGKLSKLSGDPVRGKAYVKSISDGRYVNASAMLQGARFHVGPIVGLAIGGVDVAVITGTQQAFDSGQMRLVGFDARDYRIVVVKSANHFRAWWSPIASEIVDCDPPGIASNDLSTIPYRHKVGKVYPLDVDAVYPNVTSVSA